MQAAASRFTYKGVSVLPLILLVPLIILSFSPHWSYDESMTYVNIIDVSPSQIVEYNKYNLANNHVINSLYMWWLESLGVQSLFLFRLPSLFLFGGYFVIISRLLKQQDGYVLRHIDQLMLYLWPFSIYFAQARGYAMAMVCFLGALLAFKLYLKEDKLMRLLLFMLLGIVSAISIFSFVYPFIAMIIILGLQKFKSIIKSPQRIALLATVLPVLFYIFDKGQIISKYDVAIIGRDSLFRGGTLSSLISFLTLNEFAPNWLFMIFKAILSLSLLPVIYLLVKRAKMYVEITIILVTLLLLVFAHYVFGADYPIYRGVAYLVLLFLLCFAYSNFNKNILFTIHFLIIIGIGITYLGILFYYKSQYSMNDVLADVSLSPGSVLVEDVHPATTAANHMKYKDSLHVINNCITEDIACFDNALDSVKYVICLPGRIEKGGHSGEFEPVYRVATFFYFNKIFYKRKE